MSRRWMGFMTTTCVPGTLVERPREMNSRPPLNGRGLESREVVLGIPHEPDLAHARVSNALPEAQTRPGGSQTVQEGTR